MEIARLRHLRSQCCDCVGCVRKPYYIITIIARGNELFSFHPVVIVGSLSKELVRSLGSDTLDL